MTRDIPGHHEYSLRRWAPLRPDDLVRLGRPHDGGYVVSTRSVLAASTLVSFGICDDWSFESAFLDANPEASLIALDGSVSGSTFLRRSAAAVQRSVLLLARFRGSSARDELRTALREVRTAIAFRKFFQTDVRRFRSEFVSDVSGPWAATWPELKHRESILRHGGAGLLFVKMDIEGGEYRVLSDVLKDAPRMSGLIVEFHDCDVHWDCFEALMDEATKHLAVVHVHGNNFVPLIRNTALPRTLEITFVHRGLIGNARQQTSHTYPIADLDMACDPARPDYPIEF